MRILLVGDYPPDPRLGSAKVFVKLQREFQALGHECDVLLGDEIGGSPRNPYARQAFGPVMALKAVQNTVRARGRYDVIDVASAEGFWIAKRRGPELRRTAIISRSNGLEHLNYRRMLDDHDAGLARKPWTRRIFHPTVRLTQVAAAARAADRLLLLNPVDRDYALQRRWKPESKIDVVPHGVSESFIPSGGTPSDARGRGILFCGSWTGVKGVTYLVEAFSLLLRSGFSTRLTVLGGGVPADNISDCFAPEYRSHVTIVDRAPESTVMQAYREHDVLAWPSTYEGFGMVLLEAMTQGLPIVATPVGCAPTLVASGQTGLLVPPRNAQALADALRRMLSDEAFRAGCAAAAFGRVRDMTWTNTAKETLASYARAREAVST